MGESQFEYIDFCFSCMDRSTRYESTAQGNFLSEALIENQYQFQKEVPTAVVLVYDPAKISFKAFRLTDKAMKQRTNGDGEDEV